MFYAPPMPQFLCTLYYSSNLGNILAYVRYLTGVNKTIIISYDNTILILGDNTILIASDNSVHSI